MKLVACNEVDRSRVEPLLRPWPQSVLVASREEVHQVGSPMSGVLLVFSRLTWGSSSTRLMMLEAVEKVVDGGEVWVLALDEESDLDIFPEYSQARVLQASQLGLALAGAGPAQKEVPPVTLIEAMQYLCVFAAVIAAIYLAVSKGLGLLWGVGLVVAAVPVGAVAGLLVAAVLTLRRHKSGGSDSAP